MKRWLLLGINLLFCALVSSYSPSIQTKGAAVPAGTPLTFPQLSPEEARRLLIQGMIVLPENAPRETQFAAASPDSLNLSGTLTFSSNRQVTNHNLYSAPADNGSLTTLLVNSTGDDFTPVWSPDGTEIVFASDRNGDFEIFRRTAGGQEIQLTTNTADDFHPSWSPDGNKILFTSNRSGNFFQVYSMNSDGSNPQQIGAVANNNAVYPRYSPDGTRIAFMRASILEAICTWNWDIWVMNANGGNQQQVTTQLGADIFPAWSPDGSKIVYAGCPNLLAFDLYTRNPTTGTQSQLTNTLLTSEWAAVYAPDNTYLAYASDAVGNTDIWVREVNGSSPLNWSNNPAEELAPHWKQNSDFILSGRILAAGQPVADVTIQTDTGLSTETDADGNYALGVVSGSYTITAHKRGYVFSPPAYTLSVPPTNNSLNFTGSLGCDLTYQPNLNLQPILMVTGWGGSVGTLYGEQDDQLRYFFGTEGHLATDGYVEGCNLFYATATTPYLNLANNAVVIRDNLCFAYTQVKGINPNWMGHFDVIAHSYGGLRTRAYLEEADLYGANCPGTQNRVVVDNLFTLGTPHGGEPYPATQQLVLLPFAAYIGYCAVTGGPACSGPGGQWPALWEMLPSTRLAQNLASRQPANICYHLLGGAAAQQWPVILTVGALSRWLGAYSVYLLTVPNDLAVHQESAQLLDMFPYSLLYQNTHLISTPDIHGQVPYTGSLLRSYVNPTITYTETIRPYLGDQNCPTTHLADPSNITTPDIMQLLAQQQRPVTSASVPMMDIRTGQLIGTQTISGTFALNGTGNSQLSLSWDHGDVAFSLVDPVGNPIHSGNVGSNPNVDLLTLNTGFGLISTYVITDTLNGIWHYTVTADNITPITGYRLFAIPPLPVSVAVSLPQWLPNQSSVVITATVTVSGTIPVTGGTVNAQINPPSGAGQNLPLYDNGTHADGLPNDGIFGNTFSSTQEGGVYGVVVIANGFYQGQAYIRNAFGYFTIAPATASLTGQYSDVPVNSDGDPAYEWLDILATVAVTQPGTYTLSADLYAGNTFISHAYTKQFLTPGTQIVPVRFDGNEIYQQQLNGPYLVRHVLLLDESVVTVLITSVEDAYTTAFYQYTEFGLSTGPVYLPLMRR